MEFVQGYLVDPIVESNTVRVRLVRSGYFCAIETAFLTVKGPKVGASCPEFEYEIPFKDAEELIQLCGERIITKERFLIEAGHGLIELDVFHGRLEGLVIAEIEVQDENQTIETMPWFGEEITNDARYSNAVMACAPHLINIER
jgi:CYTH domain-containing protein